MKKILAVLFVLACFISLGISQTNSYYNKGEITFQLAPTISAASFQGLFNHNVKKSYGYALKTEYWSSLNFGTGLEIGEYDYREFNKVGGIDHITTFINYRFIFDRFASQLELGAEQYLLDGSKAIQLGFGEEYCITKKIRVSADLTEHIRTNPTEDGVTGMISLKYIF